MSWICCHSEAHRGSCDGGAVYVKAKPTCGVSWGRVGRVRTPPPRGVCWLQKAVEWQQGTLGGDLRSRSNGVMLRLDCLGALRPSSPSFCWRRLSACVREKCGSLLCSCWWVVFFLVSPKREDCAFVFPCVLWRGFNFIEPRSSRKPGSGTPRVGRSDGQPEHLSPIWDAGGCLN